MMILISEQCPVIRPGTKVEIKHVFDFPSSNRQFVTIQDLENIPLDRYGKPDPIISTIPFDALTFVHE